MSISLKIRKLVMLLNWILPKAVSSVATKTIASKNIHTTAVCNEIRKLARLRVVDNSVIGKKAMTEGKPPRVIHVYTKTSIGFLGDLVLLAIKGEKVKGILVGLKQLQHAKIPRFDTNNVILIDDNGTPLGTRIQVPVPNFLRTKMKEKTRRKGADYTKMLAIASRFIWRPLKIWCLPIVK